MFLFGCVLPRIILAPVLVSKKQTLNPNTKSHVGYVGVHLYQHNACISRIDASVCTAKVHQSIGRLIALDHSWKNSTCKQRLLYVHTFCCIGIVNCIIFRMLIHRRNLWFDLWTVREGRFQRGSSWWRDSVWANVQSTHVTYQNNARMSQCTHVKDRRFAFAPQQFSNP